MNQMRLRAAAVIIALIVLIGFFISAPRVRDGSQASTQHAATVTPDVTLHDVFKKGVHTVTGSLQAPNACAGVTALASLAGEITTPRGIVVAITMTPSDGVCLQLPTVLRFSTTISAPAKLPLTATVNGNNATTTVL